MVEMKTWLQIIVGSRVKKISRKNWIEQMLIELFCILKSLSWFLLKQSKHNGTKFFMNSYSNYHIFFGFKITFSKISIQE